MKRNVAACEAARRVAQRMTVRVERGPEKLFFIARLFDRAATQRGGGRKLRSQLFTFLQSAGCANAAYSYAENQGAGTTADIEADCEMRAFTPRVVAAGRRFVVNDSPPFRPPSNAAAMLRALGAR
jgi:hypothetical protein